MEKEIINKVKEWYIEGGIFKTNTSEYTIEASENTITIKINRNNKQIEAFIDFINNLDDELFIAVCEKLGNEKIRDINHALVHNKNVDKYIELFKNALYEYVLEQYDLNKLYSKYIRELIINKLQEVIADAEKNNLTDNQDFLDFLDIINELSVRY